MNPIGPLVIRPALYEEARSLALLGNLAFDQNTKRDQGGHQTLATVTFMRLDSEEAGYQSDLSDPTHFVHVAEAPDFDNPVPVHGTNGHQLAGLSLGHSDGMGGYHLGHLYTVKSPYKTGSTLLAHEILHAMKHDAKMITALAVSDRGLNLLRNNGFGPCPWPSKYCKLDRANFGAALDRLSGHLGIALTP